MPHPRILLSAPRQNGREMKYINRAFETDWIAPLGENVDGLERELAAYTGAGAAAALSSGTAAIHLGLKYLGVSAGDRVFCSDATFAASCNPIAYEKAQPVFIDSDGASHNMSAKALRLAFEDAARRGKPPKAVVIVDLYGLPADYDALLPICEEYGVPVLEDAAEALASSYMGRKCGSFGDMAALSFNANKIITASGGGMALCRDEAAANKIKFWATQAREPFPWYEHREIGYNYRLSNISAGIARGQLETLEDFAAKRRRNNAFYRQALAGLVDFTPEPPGVESNCWLTIVFVKEESRVSRDELIAALGRADIESRPYWKPMHMQPVFRDCPFYADTPGAPVSEDLFSRGLCLPSSSFLTEAELSRVAEVIIRKVKTS